MSQSERRGAPRIAKRLPLRLTHDEGDLTTKTENISASGAYCTIRRFVPLMTKLRIRLELLDQSKPASVICEGIVVRVEPPAPAPKRASYKVAIFFSELSDHSRSLLAQYVQRHRQSASLRLRPW